MVKESQRAWLKYRRGACEDIPCLSEEYANRIGMFEAFENAGTKGWITDYGALMFECNTSSGVAAISLTRNSFGGSAYGWSASSPDGKFKVMLVPHYSDSYALSEYLWTCRIGDKDAVFHVWEDSPRRGLTGPDEATVNTLLSLSYGGVEIVRDSLLQGRMLLPNSRDFENAVITKVDTRFAIDPYSKKGEFELRWTGTVDEEFLSISSSPRVVVQVSANTYSFNRRSYPLPLTEQSIRSVVFGK